jgi:hypothetical protein
MTRIFALLAGADAVLLVVSYVLGALSKLRDGVHNPSDPIFWYHFIAGLATALLTLFVHCLIFTYFLGTGRWVKEIKLAYGLDDEPLPRLTRDLKRRVFPPALFAMLIVIATGAAGAAAQVGVSPWQLHFALSSLSLVLNFWAYGVEYSCLRTNIRVLDEVVAEVDRIRANQGLPSNAEALRQEGLR